MALKKHVVPILIYVNPNEVPEPIKKYLARDINEIDHYYAEVKRELSGKTPAKHAAAKQKVSEAFENTFKVGDKVRLPMTPASKVSHIGWNSELGIFPFDPNRPFNPALFCRSKPVRAPCRRGTCFDGYCHRTRRDNSNCRAQPD